MTNTAVPLRGLEGDQPDLRRLGTVEGGDADQAIDRAPIQRGERGRRWRRPEEPPSGKSG